MSEQTNAPAASLKPLLDLQGVDTTIDRLNERRQNLPEHVELADLETRLGELDAEMQRVKVEHHRVTSEMNKLDAEVQTIDDKIHREEEKMYSGRVVNPKELSALQAEIEMLKRRKAPMEDSDLELMVQRDELDEEIKRLQTEVDSVKSEAVLVEGKIAEAAKEIDLKLELEDRKRDLLVPRIPADVLEQYEGIKETKKGIGVGALSNGICTACREALSAMEVDKIKQRHRNGEQLFRCEHCRRLLIVE